MKLLIPIDSVSSYKSTELLPLECEHCNKIFYKHKGDVTMSLKGHPDFALRFCSLKCHHLKRVKDTHIEVACEQCHKLVLKQISWIKKFLDDEYQKRIRPIIAMLNRAIASS